MDVILRPLISPHILKNCEQEYAYLEKTNPKQMLGKNLKHMFMCFFGSRDRRDRGVQSIHFCWCFVAANGYTDPSHTPKQTTRLLQKKQKN